MEKKYSLPKDFAEKWCASLRSEKYTQGTGELTVGQSAGKDFAFCCLGVGCRMNDMPLDIMHRHSRIGTISESILVGYKIPLELKDTDIETQLMLLNDQDGYSFPQIADWIEKNIEFIES